MYLVCLTCARLTCFERDTRVCREQVTFKNYLRDQRTKDWENERRPGKNTIQNIAKTTRKRKENMIYKTWSNWWETVPSHLAVFENPLSTSCILSAKSRVCDGLRWKPSAISGRLYLSGLTKQMHFIFSQWRFSDWRTNVTIKPCLHGVGELGGPRSSGVGFFCFVSSRAWKQKKPTLLDRGRPLHVNRP